MWWVRPPKIKYVANPTAWSKIFVLGEYKKRKNGTMKVLTLKNAVGTVEAGLVSSAQSFPTDPDKLFCIIFWYVFKRQCP